MVVDFMWPTPKSLTQLTWIGCAVIAAIAPLVCNAQEAPNTVLSTSDDQNQSIVEMPVDRSRLDPMAILQLDAMENTKAAWGHWGIKPKSYSGWTNHSNRLIPVYVFGDSFASYMYQRSGYRDPARLVEWYGQIPTATLNPNAQYADQTDIYRLQRAAIERGKKYVFLIVFDGMDWQTTQAAAIYKSANVTYHEGRGSGLLFQDYRGTSTDFGFVVTSPYADDCDGDPDSQQITTPWKLRGGFDANLAGDTPWSKPKDPDYLIGRSRVTPHAYTDSSSSATSMTAGIKTFNGAINMDSNCQKVETIAHWAQRERHMLVGAITSVPISHATPAAAYAHNVSRDDYQDLTRDMIGLPSVVHRDQALSGMDVVIGGGWGEESEKSGGQGSNFIPGNRYLAQQDLERVSVEQNGRYVIAQRQPGRSGTEVLLEATQRAIDGNHRLLGFFGTKGGHLPFQTANGDYLPTRGVKGTEVYTPADLVENPTLAQITSATLQYLERSKNGFWLLIESGDVDWGNHTNNLDNAIGAVFSGDQALGQIIQWIEAKNAWNDSLVIVTADHGHYLNLTDPQAIAAAASNTRSNTSDEPTLR